MVINGILSRLIPDDELTRELYEILLQANAFFGQGVSMEELMTLLKKSRNTIMARIKAAPEGHIIRIAGRKVFLQVGYDDFQDELRR